MKEIIADVLDFKVPTLVYESVDEGDKAAGRAGAVLDECNKNLQYRGSNADARELIEAVVIELTGITPKTVDKEVERDGKKVIIQVRDVKNDSEGKFVARALAESDGKVTKEQVQAMVESRARNGWTYTDDDGKVVSVPPISVDIKPRERKPIKPPKLGEEYKTAAASLLEKFDDDKINSTLKKYIKEEEVNFARGEDTAKNVETLGWLVKKYQKAKLAAGVL